MLRYVMIKIAASLLASAPAAQLHSQDAANHDREVHKGSMTNDYLGEFERDDGVPIYVVDAGGTLAVVVGGNTFALLAKEEDSFELVGVGEIVIFERDEQDNVVSVRDSRGVYPRTGAVPPAISQRFKIGEGSPYKYAAPIAGEDDLSTGVANQFGIDQSALESIIDDVRSGGEFANVHSLLISRRNTLLLEEYFKDYDQATSHNLRSATKSVISALVGAAIQRGDVTLEDRPLARIAQASSLDISAHKMELTLADMLDMRHGLQCDDWDNDSLGNEVNIYGTPDWTEFILAIPDDADRQAISYCSAMPLMVGRYLELATGQTLPDYAGEVLLAPLGIKNDDWSWDFELRAKSDTHGGQIHLRPRDMLRFGRLYARGGLTEDGSRVLPQGWVANSFDAVTPLGDWRTYNDFWWRYEVERRDGSVVPVHMASGVGGQRIAIIPSLELLVVLTGGSFSFGRPGPTKIIERIILSTSR